MELNQNSWFARRYLQCHSWNLPSTVCSLVFTTLVMTLFYTITIAAYVGIVSAMSIVAYHGFSSYALSASFNYDEIAFLMGVNAIGWTLLIGFGIVAPVLRHILEWSRVRRDQYNQEHDEWLSKLYKGEITARQFDEWYATSKYTKQNHKNKFFKTPIDLLLAIHARIKDKTCVLINWK